MTRLLVLTVLCGVIVACGGTGSPGTDKCLPTAEHPYNVTTSTLPLAGFVPDPSNPDDGVCYAPNGPPGSPLCGTGLYKICNGGAFTYCDSPYAMADFRWDPAVNADRLVCRPR